MTAQQLKNSILQMAVQGKLIPQDPNDEPASALVERIRAEKEQLIKEKKIKKEKNPSVIFRGADNLPYEKVGKNEPVCIADEVPFEIPDSWEWVRIKSLGAIIRGSGIKRNETVGCGYPCVRYGEIYTTYNTSFTSTVSFIPEEINEKCRHFSYGDILMTLTGENKPDIAKAVAYLGIEPVAAGGDLAYWTAHGMNPLYLSYLLASPYVVNRKVELATGDIIVHISGDKIGSILIPIPPLNEQMRIVEKIQEAEYQIRQYGEKEQELTILQTTFPEAMKKSILLQAVQGKLVEQDPADEPAEVLLERIRAEKQRLIKEGKIKKDKHESIIFRRDNSHYEKLDNVERCIDDELPFNIPESWCWCRLKSIVNVVSARRVHQSDWRSEGVPFYRSREIGKLADTGFVDNELHITEALYNKLSSSGVPHGGDLMVTAVGTLGKTYIVKDDDRFYYKDASVICFENFSKVDPAYLKILMCSPYMEDQIKQNSAGTTVSTITIVKANEYLIPLPPLKEQKRIADQIDYLQQHINKL